MTIPYLSELLVSRCEDIAETITEMMRVGAVPPNGSKSALAWRLYQAATLVADAYRVVPKDGEEGSK